MPDYSRLMQLIAEMRLRLDELAEELGRLQGEEGAPPAEAAPTAPPAGALYDLSKVIPPTLTDNPDSIVGGSLTSDFPDCCAVGNDLYGYFCTGTLIAPNIIVTAAHCPVQTDSRMEKVFLLGSDIERPEEGEIVRVKEQYVHEEYNSATNEHDICVLVLEQDSSVEPRHVAQGLELQALLEPDALLVGFGTIDFAGRKGYGKKREVKVPITSIGCEADVAETYGCWEAREIVAGHRGLNRDSCKGDSGGPLYVLGETGYYLLGATSRGVTLPGARTCGDGGIYVRVDHYLDWIFEKTGVRIAGPLI
ncbi:MAG: S1 family peptidase [Ardenticatenaceae bacterium]